MPLSLADITHALPSFSEDQLHALNETIVKLIQQKRHVNNVIALTGIAKGEWYILRNVRPARLNGTVVSVAEIKKTMVDIRNAFSGAFLGSVPASCLHPYTGPRPAPTPEPADAAR